MKTIKYPLIGGLLMLATLWGCGPKLEVDSNTIWTGAIAGDNGTRSVSGAGHRTFDGESCGTFQKETEGGYLQVSIKHGGLFGGGGPPQQTTAAYGVVSVCE